MKPRGRRPSKTTEKRTEAMPADERARTTSVARPQPQVGSGSKWVADLKARGDGWRDIKVLAADELALWMESCPGVETWLREHLGIGSLGDIGIGDWFARWAIQTNPATPAAVLTAGRRQDIIRILDALAKQPDRHKCGGIERLRRLSTLSGPPSRSAPEEDCRRRIRCIRQRPLQSRGPLGNCPSLIRPPAARRCWALRQERTIVIEDQDGWRRWSVHPTPHDLIPLFIPDSVADAIDAGHHVVSPRLSSGSPPRRETPAS